MICHSRAFLLSLRSVERAKNTRKKVLFLRTQATTTTTTTTTTSTSHKLNCNHALIKAHEGTSFRELILKPVKVLQGIGPVHEKQLSELGIKTVQELADYKFFHLARAIQTLANTAEEEGGGHAQSGSAAAIMMNINKGVDKAYETQSFKEILQAPVHALQGIGEKAAGATWQQLGVKTINDLANWKYAKWAEALHVVSKYED
jgi:predicted flap endonuclease-1-like 5' DNA nuclease